MVSGGQDRNSKAGKSKSDKRKKEEERITEKLREVRNQKGLPMFRSSQFPRCRLCYPGLGYGEGMSCTNNPNFPKLLVSNLLALEEP